MNRLTLPRLLLGASILVLASACGGAAVVPSSGAASATPVVPPASVAASQAAPTEAPSAAPESPSTAPSPEPSVAALCMDPEIVEILETRINKLDQLSPAQLAALVAALKGYGDPDVAEWRDDMVRAIEAKDWQFAGSGAMQIVSGQVTFERCP